MLFTAEGNKMTFPLLGYAVPGAGPVAGAVRLRAFRFASARGGVGAARGYGTTADASPIAPASACLISDKVILSNSKP